MGSILGQVNTQTSRVNHFMWLAPTSIEDKFGKVVSIGEAISGIQAGATAGVNLLYGNKVEGMSGLMSMAVSHLPFLGGFYGAALSKVPNLIANYTAIVKERDFRQWNYPQMYKHTR